VGDVDGVDKIRDAQICDEIIRNNLLTGHSIERKLTEGARLGVEISPLIVVTVLIQGIQRDSDGALTLRHPRIAVVRTDKQPDECDTIEDIRQLYLKERFS
jgi:ATP-dependent DNA ligase